MATTMLTTDERIEMVQQAQEMLHEVIELVEQAVAGTGAERYTEAYLLAQLKIRAGSGHGYLTNDQTLDDVIDSLREDEEDDGPEEEVAPLLSEEAMA
jgi:hypothetical protein